MEKVPWDVGQDEVVVGVRWGVRGRKRVDAKNMLFGGEYTYTFTYFNGIRQGALQSLFLIC